MVRAATVGLALANSPHGFPLYDERGVSSLSPELQKFLDEGPPPIAFTFGSAMWHASELLGQSLTERAC